MKKLLFLLFFAVCTTLSSFANRLDNLKACGTITFKDGHEETYEELPVLSGHINTIQVKIGEGKKDFKTIPAEDVLYVTYWSKNFPEKESIIYCLKQTYVNKKNQVITYCSWGMKIMSSEWGSVYRLCDYFYINHKTGDLEYMVVIEENLFSLFTGAEDWQKILLKREDSDQAILVGRVRGYRDGKTGEHALEYSWPNGKKSDGAECFKDNPEIYQQILDGTLKASDLQYILNQM